MCAYWCDCVRYDCLLGFDTRRTQQREGLYCAINVWRECILQELLPGYTTLEFGLFALYPHRRYLPKKVRCFIDFMLAEFVE